MWQVCAPGVLMLVSQTFSHLPFRVCPIFIHYFRLGSYYEELVWRRLFYSEYMYVPHMQSVCSNEQTFSHDVIQAFIYSVNAIWYRQSRCSFYYESRAFHFGSMIARLNLNSAIGMLEGANLFQNLLSSSKY